MAEPIPPALAPCDGCGLVIAGGTEGCDALFHTLNLRVAQDPAIGRPHRMLVDTYCLQYPERYCVSAKSLAAHLTGLCLALEYGNAPNVERALHRWLDGTATIGGVPIEKPPLPAFHGAVTIGDVRDAPDPHSLAEAIQRWAATTWAAYAPLHPLAHRWIAAALP